MLHRLSVSVIVSDRSEVRSNWPSNDKQAYNLNAWFAQTQDCLAGIITCLQQRPIAHPVQGCIIPVASLALNRAGVICVTAANLQHSCSLHHPSRLFVIKQLASRPLSRAMAAVAHPTPAPQPPFHAGETEVQRLTGLFYKAQTSGDTSVACNQA